MNEDSEIYKKIVKYVKTGKRVYVKSRTVENPFRSFLLLPDGRVEWGYFCSIAACSQCGAQGDSGLPYAWSENPNYSKDFEDFKRTLCFLREKYIVLVTLDEKEMLREEAPHLLEEAEAALAVSKSRIEYLKKLKG